MRDDLADLLGTRHTSIGQVSLNRWPENVRIIEALDLGEHNIQTILRTSIVFDAELYIDDDELSRLIEFVKDKPVILLDTRWDVASREIESKVRVNVVADFIFVWNTQRNSAEGMSLLRMGFTEQDLLAKKP
jgi:hypothetical protein